VRLAKAILLRLLYGLLSLVFISFVTFIADEIAPGDAATIRAGEKATPEAVERIREEMGLNRPWPIRYAEYVGGLARLDLGESYYGTREPVIDIIARNLPSTMRLALMAICLAAAVGIFLGTIAAINRNRFGDRATLTFSTLGVTIPNFVLAPIFVLIFSLNLGYFPMSWQYERPEGDLIYLVLPVVVLSLRPMAMLTRLTRASMVDTMQLEFIKLAVAKGVPPARLIIRHGLRNALLPIITAIGTSFGFLLTGSFIIERAFLLPGIGREGIEAIQQGNTPVLQAVILITGGMFILVNLLVDLTLPMLDPRIREAQI
jgi:peptide/nickel transport system permease protein